MQTVVGEIQALHDHVIVRDMAFGERRTQAGIVLLDDNGRTQGIRPRWACVHAVGPEQTDVKPGDWVLVEHGRWTRGFQLINSQGETQTIRRVDVDGMLAVSDQPPQFDETLRAGD